MIETKQTFIEHKAPQTDACVCGAEKDPDEEICALCEVAIQNALDWDAGDLLD